MVRVGVLGAAICAVLVLGTPVLAGDFNGAYLGAHAGGAWGDVEVRDTTGGVTPGPFSYDVDGAFGGGTIGYNFQFSNVVLGVEGDLGYMDASGGGVIPSSIRLPIRTLRSMAAFTALPQAVLASHLATP